MQSSWQQRAFTRASPCAKAANSPTREDSMADREVVVVVVMGGVVVVFEVLLLILLPITISSGTMRLLGRPCWWCCGWS